MNASRRSLTAMPTQPFQQSAASIDLSARLRSNITVSASPADATETVIGTLTIPDFNVLSLAAGVRLRGWAAFTVGTNGVSATLRIRQTNVAGNVVASTGATTVTAANLVAREVMGFDASPSVGTYVLTLTVGSASAASAVSGLAIGADVV